MYGLLKKAFLSTFLCVSPFMTAEAEIGNGKLELTDFTDVATVAQENKDEYKTFVLRLSLSIDFLTYHFLDEGRADLAAAVYYHFNDPRKGDVKAPDSAYRELITNIHYTKFQKNPRKRLLEGCIVGFVPKYAEQNPVSHRPSLRSYYGEVNVDRFLSDFSEEEREETLAQGIRTIAYYHLVQKRKQLAIGIMDGLLVPNSPKMEQLVGEIKQSPLNKSIADIAIDFIKREFVNGKQTPKSQLRSDTPKVFLDN